MRGMSKAIIAMLAVWWVGVLAGCNPPPKPTATAPDVTVSTPVEQEVVKHLEYTGTTAALEAVDIRARVPGFLEKICFQPSAKVKAGDLLFVIDPRQYEAAVKQAEATLEAQKANYKLAKTEEEMWASLEKKEAVSPLKLQEKTTRSDVSKASVDQAQAELENARLNLEYTQVKSPINGRVGRNLVDVGNLVGATEKTLLTTVVNDESIYCYFNVNELDLLAVRRIHHGKAQPEDIKSLKIPAFLGLADETGYPREGIIDYSAPQISASTGTVQVRAIFPNLDGFLVPGMFARVRVPVAKQTALLVPEAAIQFDQGGRYVLVVDNDNIVQVKRIKQGMAVGPMRVVEQGLNRADRVIVSGVARARPGVKVNPVQPAPGTPQTGSKTETGQPR